ncbi:hypothetical protein [Flavihumibacter sp. UBA7668]|uniref:hypothetical protein n=1 Tax=Flavihumibacter sp. UBA7668 TaxID=1946542 RepID=UPI0025C6987A|nr:hypothetical protein [Flavihumibacter sp. UBA7668]
MASLLLLVTLAGSFAKEVFTFGTTVVVKLQSATKGATYEISLGLPDNYNPAESSETVYTLDGKEFFGFIANRAKEISTRLSTKSIDYTPTKMSSVTGGVPGIMHFIESLLMPKMEADYHADTCSNQIMQGWAI